MTTKLLIWNDGHVDAAPTWRTLEAAIRSEQWDRYGRRAFRREMARRAHAWSGATVAVTGNSRAFLRRLEEAGLFRLEEER